MSTQFIPPPPKPAATATATRKPATIAPPRAEVAKPTPRSATARGTLLSEVIRKLKGRGKETAEKELELNRQLGRKDRHLNGSLIVEVRWDELELLIENAAMNLAEATP